MFVRLPNNAARCIALILCSIGPALIMAQSTSSPTPTTTTALSSFVPTHSPTDSPTDAVPTTNPTKSSVPIPVAPSFVAAQESMEPTIPAIATPAPSTPSPTTPSPVESIDTVPSTPFTMIAETNLPPSSSPVTAPIVATENPTKQPITAAPTTSPPIMTISPTQSPMQALETTSPTGSPSATSTSKATTAVPSQPPMTASPSSALLVPTTITPSDSPIATASPTTQSPSLSKTQPPMSYQEPTRVTGLKITLTGISRINDTSKWASTTSNFFATQYEDSNQISNSKVDVKYTSEKVSSTEKRRTMMMMMRGRRRRGLSQTDTVEVTYEQYTTYSTTNPSLTLDDVLQMPLMDITQQDEYISALKQLDGYASLTAVSTISLPSDGENDDVVDPSKPNPATALPLWAIIVIAVVGALLLSICLGPFVYRKFCRSKSSEFSQEGDIQRHGGSSLPFNVGDDTVGTTDYDYSKAYAASGNFSLSDAGGTIGSRTRQTAADTMPHQSGNNTVYSEDPTYNEAVYEGSSREEIIDVYAPAGKLGVVIDTPNDGAPIVHAVKDTSPIADKIRVGDKLVAVDDQDVRTMTAIQVSKLISKKSVNASRKMTVIRRY